MRPSPRCVVWVLLVSACAGPHQGARSTDPPPTRDRVEAPREARPAEPPRSGRPFADTAVTPIGNALTDWVLAVAQGEPAAPPDVPLDAPLGEAPRVDWRTDQRPGDLHVLGIAFELELIMKRGDPDPADESPARYGAIRATLALSAGGLRVVGLRPRVVSASDQAGDLPTAMAPFAEVVRELLASLRAEDISAYALTDEDRALLDNETVWSQMVEDRVPPGRVRLLAQMLHTLPEAPIAYLLDDVAVLARDADANLYSLTVDFDPEGASFALRTDPLVEVRQLWPLRADGGVLPD